MRTRRSPRNQERLFKALFKSTSPAPVPVVTPCCLNCNRYTGTRNRGECVLHGIIVNGLSQKECFAP